MRDIPDTEKEIYLQMYHLWSKVNSDFIRERPSLDLNVSFIEEAKEDPLNAYEQN
jgi:hypothetical protein